MRISGSRLIGTGLVLVAATGAALAGCSGSATTDRASTTSTTVSAPAGPQVTAAPATRAPGESEGAFVFRTQCATCHGAHGQGNIGPSLVGIASRMSEADQSAQVHNGGGFMPAFGEKLSEADIQAVITYTRTELH